MNIRMSTEKISVDFYVSTATMDLGSYERDHFREGDMDYYEQLENDRKIAEPIAKRFAVSYSLDVDDLVSESLLALFKARSTVTYSDATAYQATVVRNALIDYVRKQQRQVPTVSTSQPISDEGNLTVGDCLLDSSVDVEYSVQLQQRLARLSLKERRVINLRLKGTPIRQVADELHIGTAFICRTLKSFAATN
jgi:RNA polymerase sigma factor (sigma-70 family)